MNIWCVFITCIIVLPGYLLMYIWSFWFFKHVDNLISYSVDSFKSKDHIKKIMTRIDNFISDGKYNIDDAVEMAYRLINGRMLSDMV